MKFNIFFGLALGVLLGIVLIIIGWLCICEPVTIAGLITAMLAYAIAVVKINIDRKSNPPS